MLVKQRADAPGGDVASHPAAAELGPGVYLLFESADGEGGGDAHGDLAGAQCLADRLSELSQLHPLLDTADVDAEAPGDVGCGNPGAGERGKSVELVDRVERLGHASTVLHGLFWRMFVGFPGAILRCCPVCADGDRHRAQSSITFCDEPGVIPPVALCFGLG